MGDDLRLSEHAARNRAEWNADAPNWVERARANWASEPHWGMWHVPEAELHVLPDMRSMDVIDLGCGTGYWCAWFARLGASPVGLDVSEAQLATAAELQKEHRIDFPLVHASGEDVPYPDASFDLVFSEYGAAIWCDPGVWIPEAHRLLRPGGRLIFLGNSPLSMLCAPPDDTPVSRELLRAQFGDLGRMEWPDSGGVNFCLGHGEMLALLRETGFEVEALHEVRAPAGDDEVRFFVGREWARQWPCEDIWVARKR